MTSSGAAHNDLTEDNAPEPELAGPERRCLVTGAVMPREQLVRFAVGPGGVLVPDIAERLPGRGLWVTCQREPLRAALTGTKNVFNRAAGRAVIIPPGCLEQTGALLRQRLIDLTGFARRAGAIVCGFEKVEGLARKKRVEALLFASDSGRDGRGKLEALAPYAHIVDILDSRTLSGIFGTIGIVVYAAVSDKAHAARLALASSRAAAVLPSCDYQEAVG